ncbi:hypothetical protein BBK82_30455 [Lentzea guizhouensis]|uniref:Uncharacterized protein n=1 Tax=Lentzea guizhouensis TaxID=1586287 RepID=A0A1B2HPT7_9PSEU|nr:hypothetical protein BBK82_30455 [Lentzea guizhouensis]
MAQPPDPVSDRTESHERVPQPADHVLEGQFRFVRPVCLLLCQHHPVVPLEISFGGGGEALLGAPQVRSALADTGYDRLCRSDWPT